MSIRKPLILMALAAALMAPAGAAFARDQNNGPDHRWEDDQGNGRGRDHGRDHGRDDARHHDRDRPIVVVRPAPPRPDPRAYSHGYNRGYHDGARFADRDRGRMRGWYTRYPSYYRPMPPGHYRQLVRGGYLPRGYYYEAPPVLVRDFEPLPRGYGYYVVDRDIVIASIATGLILDVLLGGN